MFSGSGTGPACARRTAATYVPNSTADPEPPDAAAAHLKADLGMPTATEHPPSPILPRNSEHRGPGVLLLSRARSLRGTRAARRLRPFIPRGTAPFWNRPPSLPSTLSTLPSLNHRLPRAHPLSQHFRPLLTRSHQCHAASVPPGRVFPEIRAPGQGSPHFHFVRSPKICVNYNARDSL